jgi:hypothetical protein
LEEGEGEDDEEDDNSHKEAARKNVTKPPAPSQLKLEIPETIHYRSLSPTRGTS